MIGDLLSNISFNNLTSGLNLYYMPTVGFTDIIDILVVAYLIYKIIFWIKETRAWTLFKGIMVILIFALIAVVLNLNTIVWILSNAVSVGIIAIVVVFQPELRRALEKLGNEVGGRGYFAKLFNFDFIKGNDKATEGITKKTVDEILKAVEKMSAVKTGALILIERGVPLGDHERTGIAVDAVVTSQLLINIFEKNTPLHDGAVIIKNNRVAAATCYLPLTESQIVSKDLGTRHRAALGASEVSDADILVVSEETGSVSLAREGVLYRNLSSEALSKMLIGQQGEEGRKKITFFKARRSSDE